MKKITSTLVALLAGVMVVSQVNALQPRKKVATVQSLTTMVTDEISTLAQILEQASMIVNNTGNVADAKAKIRQNMSKLDASTKKDISNFIKTITMNKDKDTVQKAYEHLVAYVNNASAHGNVVVVAEAGRAAIEAAPEDMKQSVIEQQIQNIQAANEQAAQASYMNRIIAGVKAAAAMPGDLLFGSEQSKAKDRFNAAIGAVATTAATAAVAYGAYKLTPEKTRAKWFAQVKRLGGRELSLEEKEAAGEELSFLESQRLYNQRKKASIEAEQKARGLRSIEKSRQKLAQQEEDILGPQAPSVSERFTNTKNWIWNQGYDVYNKLRYGETPAEKQARLTSEHYNQILPE